MESPGIFGRLGEKVLGWIALGLLIFLGIAIYQMPGETKAAIWSAIWRGFLWLAFVLAVPWSARLLMRRVLEAGTNWAGVALIGAFVVADAVVGILLMTGWPDGAWAWLATLGLLTAAGTYNYLVTEYLAEMAGG